MTFIFDVLPAMMIGGTALATSAGVGAGTAFGAGLSATALTGLGFTAPVVAATTAGTGLAASGLGATLAGGLASAFTAKNIFGGISALTSLATASGIMSKGPQASTVGDVLAIQGSTPGDSSAEGASHMKRLKQMVAGHNKVQTASKEGGLLKTSDSQKLGSS